MTLLLATWLAIFIGETSTATRTEEVLFRNRDIQLTGTLSVPPGPGGRKCPAVVLLGGSGPSPRAGVKAYADQLTSMGLVTLAFDKRGSGTSGGDWTEASLDDLAEDARAAMAFIAARPEVDPARVGVWGVSQAGWVIPLLSSKSPRPAFSIVVTGGGATPREVEMYGYRQAFERAGVSLEDRKKAEALLDRYFTWLGTGRDRAALVAEIERVRSESWFSQVPIDRVLPSDAGRPKWEWVATLDPSASIAAMRTPTLVILGSGDPLSPAGISATRWRDALERGGNRDASVQVFDDMGHAARQGGGHSASNPISPDYTEAVRTFLAKYVMTAR